MIWPLIDPINASTKSSSKLTAATPPANVHTPWNVGGRPEEATHPAIADVWRLYEATTLPRALVSMQTRRRESLRRTALFCDFEQRQISDTAGADSAFVNRFIYRQ